MLVNGEKIKRGDIFFANLESRQGSHDAIQRGKRPVVVVSNNMANKYSPAITIVPLTTKNKHNLPTHVSFGLPNNGEMIHNTALCEQVQTINVSQLYYKIDVLEDSILKDVDKCLEVALCL